MQSKRLRKHELLLSKIVIQTLALFSCFLLSGCFGKGSYYGGSLATASHTAPTLISSPVKKHILVLGGTKGTGLEVVKLALRRGHKVTAVSRNPDKLKLRHPELEIVAANITTASDMQRVVSSKDVVINAVGLSPGSSNVTVFSRGITEIIRAMNEHKVERLISISAIGVGESHGHGGFIFDYLLSPFILNSDLKDKELHENIIKSSSANWTIIRPGFLTNNKGAGNYRVITSMEGIEAGVVSREDVAHFIVASFESNLYSKKTVLLSN